MSAIATITVSREMATKVYHAIHRSEELTDAQLQCALDFLLRNSLYEARLGSYTDEEDDAIIRSYLP